MEKINLHAFSDDNFDATVWINDAFRCIDSDANTESHASNMVFKLQLLVQEVNHSLEETALQMIHNLPKVTRESETLHHEACQLRDEMETVKEKLNKIEYESSESMNQLFTIDVIKTRMHDTCKALREADNWTTLSSDVEDVFHGGDFIAIANKLMGMQNSLEILIDVPDYKQRVEHLEHLKDRFESMLQMPIISALTAQNDSTHLYVKLFKDIKRITQLKRYYHNCFKSQLTTEWSRIIRMDPEETLIDWLNALYDSLVSVWHSQSNFCLNVMFPNDFESTLELLCDLFVDVLTNLQPNIASCIMVMLDKQQNSRDSVLFLIEIKQITDHFAKSIETSVATAESGKYLVKPHVDLLAQIIYSPYREIIERYGDAESSALLNELNNLKIISHPSESLSKAFLYAKDAEKRCHQFTQSFAIPCLLNVFETYFDNYLQNFKTAIDGIRSKSSNETKSSIPDWSSFQLSLFNLQASGELIIQLELLQQQLFNNIMDVSKKVSMSSRHSASPFLRFHDLLLNSTTKNELMDLINNIVESESPFVLLMNIYDKCKNICSHASSVVFEIALNYIDKHLNDISNLVSITEQSAVTSEEDMHSFTLSPNEYITQIGQYLLTIPQHIEPFILQENNAFKTALMYCELKANDTVGNESTAAEYLLDCITTRAVDSFVERILKLKNLNGVAKQQLITDIEYLNDVLDDLGLSPGNDIQKLLSLLKASPDEFKIIAKDTNPILLRAIEGMIKKN